MHLVHRCPLSWERVEGMKDGADTFSIIDKNKVLMAANISCSEETIKEIVELVNRNPLELMSNVEWDRTLERFREWMDQRDKEKNQGGA